jgi:energy-converting hydrogenase Eha subunit E
MEDVRLILSALWAAVTFCLAFAAILGNYKPGHLEGMITGEVDGIKTTQEVLVGNAIMMVIPSVMVFLSLTLPDPIIRWANIILGIVFIGVIFITLAYYFTSNIQTWAYYYVFTITEIVLYALIVWYSWKWV